jgi:hypothetical protein
VRQDADLFILQQANVERAKLQQQFFESIAHKSCQDL